MVSTRTIIIVAVGLTVVAGLAYFTYQYTFSDTLGGQLARSRLGLDEAPPIRSLLNQEADPSKPLSQQKKDPINDLVDRVIENITRSKGGAPPLGGYGANAAMFYNNNDLAAEEEKYEPWAIH